MKRVVVVQARTGSTRLPGKVLLELSGVPMLACQLRRLKRCRMVDDIVIATTSDQKDNAIVKLANSEGLRWFKGSRDDVLSRYRGAANEAKADIVVRVTSDCPLIDPDQTDEVIRRLQENPRYDYVSNIIKRSFPRGLDTEAFFKDTLDRLNRLATSTPAREHVTCFLLVEQPGLFVSGSVTDSEDNSDLRWTVDTLQDLEMIRKIYSELGLCRTDLPYKDILRHVRANPEIAAINEGIRQKAL